MIIASRNVNGIRSVIQKGFADWVNSTNPDIICLQEVKAFENQIPEEIRFLMPDYDYVWHHGSRPGYAGTAIFFRNGIQIKEKKADFDQQMFYEDGRITQLDFTFNDCDFSLLNCYFPNGGTRSDGTEMLSYKLLFYTYFRDYILQLQKIGKWVITTGDFNICHHPIDIANPVANKNSIGFLPIERAEMDKLENEHFVDVFRHFNPSLANKYTWWSYRAGARARNIGWRLDYFRVSPSVLQLVQSVQHQENQQGSDHCPILLEIR
ncbi:exodeoxyribonuclease III [candidate division SR1 bacterium]|nr:exodeoxyribonuclease III [candidate division SR1 bacterium]